MLTHRLHVYSNPHLPVVHQTVSKYRVFIMCHMKRVCLHVTYACCCCPKHRNAEVFDCTVISGSHVSSNTLWSTKHPVYTVDFDRCEEGWESSLRKMGIDVTEGPLKMVQGNISLNEPLVIFRYNLSFLFLNYIDLPWGKDLCCEYITCFKNHQLIWNGATVLGEAYRCGDTSIPSIWKLLPY